MFLFTPDRLRALTWLGGFVWLVLMTEGTCTWALWRDGDSVAQLSDARVCELAVLASMTGGGDCTVAERHELWMRARVQPRAGEPVEVCFLKAARWFAVDHGVGIGCPAVPPSAPERIASYSQEQRLEHRWQEAVTSQRQRAQTERFKASMKQMLEQQRALEPFACPPDLSVRGVPALDAALLMGTPGAWHFVSDDDLEAVLDPKSRNQWNPVPPPPPLIALVDLKERRLPEKQNPGAAHGTLALVDWVHHKVLCQANITVVQPENAPRDLSRPDVLMPDFKQRLVGALDTQLSLMTGGALVLQPTW